MSLAIAEQPNNERVARALGRRRELARRYQEAAGWMATAPFMAPVLSLARRCAGVPTAPVLIQAERGSGAIPLARMIHENDPIARASNLRVVPGQFLASAEMRGVALGGTLVIENVEATRAAGQAWLSEVLADRPGSAVRIVATTRRPIRELQGQVSLGQDLLQALDVFRLVVPPLRQNPEDLLLLADRFLTHYGSVSGRPQLRFGQCAQRRLLGYAFPGNVSELRNVVERAVALQPSESDEIREEAVVFYEGRDAGPPLERRPAPPVRPVGDQLPTLAQVEREYLETLIRLLKGRRTDIARVMGISYPTVLKKIARHGLNVREIVISAGGPGTGA